jgi:multidrug efflux pump subunit AcrB
VRRRYEGLLVLALTWRARTLIGFFAIVLLSFGLVPFLGQNFFPAVESDQIKLHVRAQTGTRIEDVSALCGRIEDAIRARMIPPAHLDTIVDNIGMPVSGINLAYGNSGTIGVGDADILISLKGATAGDYVQKMREQLPRLFPGTVFSFLPADIITQIINFGLPAPIDLQIVGNNLDANRSYANKLLARIRHVPASPMRVFSRQFNAYAEGQRGPLAGFARRADRKRCRHQHARHAGRQHPDGADLLAQSGTTGCPIPSLCRPRNMISIR